MIMKTRFIVLNTRFIVFDTQFLVLCTKFIILTHHVVQQRRDLRVWIRPDKPGALVAAMGTWQHTRLVRRTRGSRGQPITAGGINANVAGRFGAGTHELRPVADVDDPGIVLQAVFRVKLLEEDGHLDAVGRAEGV